MPSNGDHIQMKVFQTLTGFSQEILNVYYFEVVSISETTPLQNMNIALREWFFLTFAEPLRQVQTTLLSYNRVEFNCIEAYETDFTVVTPETVTTGLQATEFNSPQTAWSFQLIRLFRTTRHGSKRIAGVPEGLVQNGFATSAALTLLEDVADVIDNVPNVDFGTAETMTLRSVIAKTPIFPATLPSVFNPVSSVAYRGIGSQNSRKQLL